MRRSLKSFSLCALMAIFWWLAVVPVYAHPGNTASDGCHYCRTNCASWGVPANQRHCHGGGSSGGGSSSGGSTGGSSAPPPPPSDTTAPDQPRVSVTGSPGPQPVVKVTGEPGARVAIAAGGGTVGSGQLDSGGTTTIAITLADGTHELTVTLTDAAGNRSSAASARAEVDATAPAAPVVEVRPAPTSDDDTVIRLEGEPGAKAAVSVSGADSKKLSGRIGASGTLDLDGMRLTDGTWTVEAQLTDAAGNASGVTREEFDLAVPAPAAADLEVEITASDVQIQAVGPKDGRVSVVFSGPGEIAETIDLDETGRGQAAFSLPDGRWTLSSVASDWREEHSASADHGSVVIDTSGPVFSLSVDEALLGSGTLAWALAMEEDGLVQAVVSRDGEEVGRADGLEGLLEGLGSGEYLLAVTASDPLGNETVEEMLLTVAAPASTSDVAMGLGLLAAMAFGVWKLIALVRRRFPRRGVVEGS